jgi:hypothetical protein
VLHHANWCEFADWKLETVGSRILRRCVQNSYRGGILRVTTKRRNTSLLPILGSVGELAVCLNMAESPYRVDDRDEKHKDRDLRRVLMYHIWMVLGRGSESGL